MSNTVFALTLVDRVEDVHIVRYDFDPNSSYAIMNCASACVYIPGRVEEEKERHVKLTNKDTGATLVGILDVSTKSAGKPANERVRLRGQTLFSTKEAARSAAGKIVKAIQDRDASNEAISRKYEADVRAALGIVLYF